METVAWIVTSSLLAVRHVAGYYRYSTAYLQDSCSCTSISHLHCEPFTLDPLSQGAGNVALSRSGHFYKEFYCQFVIRAPSKRHRIMLTVNHINIPTTTACKAGTLKIYDGHIGENPIQLAALCGDEVPQFSFRSNTDLITLTYHQSLAIINKQKAFNLTFTYFRVANPGRSCNRTLEYSCVNGLCIYKQLECDGWNNCGDRTDENIEYHVCGQLLTTSDPVVGIAVGVTVASLLVITMASLIAYSIQHKKGPFYSDSVAMETIQTSPEAGAQSRVDDVVDDVILPLSGPVLDVESMTSSSDIYRHPGPPSYNSLFPDLGHSA